MPERERQAAQPIVRRTTDSSTVCGRNDESEAAMQIIHLPDTAPEPGPERVELAALARRGHGSPALLRAVASRPESRRGVPSFQSCV